MSIVVKAPNGLFMAMDTWRTGPGGVGWCDPVYVDQDAARWATRERAMEYLRGHVPMVAKWVDEGSVKLIEVDA